MGVCRLNLVQHGHGKKELGTANVVANRNLQHLKNEFSSSPLPQPRRRPSLSLASPAPKIVFASSYAFPASKLRTYLVVPRWVPQLDQLFPVRVTHIEDGVRRSENETDILDLRWVPKSRWRRCSKRAWRL